MTKRLAVVTGASSGIGRASARKLAHDGFEVICAARRTDRIEELAGEIGGRAVTCDVTKADDLKALADEVGPRLDVLVANAGGALGTEAVGDAKLSEWQTMYDTNVIGAASSIQVMLPALEEAHGVIIAMGSVAGMVAYEGGAGYCGAKAALHSMLMSLRLELFDKPVRISEIDPGLVESDEFSLVRYRGDAKAAAKVYEGVPGPLTQEDIAECVSFIAGLPEHVNIDQLVVRPRAQAAAHKVYRA